MNKFSWFGSFVLSVVVLAVATQTGCATSGGSAKLSPNPSASRPVAKGLSGEEAHRRAEAIESVRYDLSVSLDAEQPEFHGISLMRVQLRQLKYPLTIDFTGGAVEVVLVDGVPIRVEYNGFFITIPKERLAAGAHRIAIRFRRAYNRSGEGLHRFKDPEDGRVYTYSDFEPYDANQFFPCIDQPDLKARFTLKVEAPSAWTVISTMRESAVKEAGSRKTWSFPETPPLSTYYFSMHAGEYRMWRAKAGRIPLRLFARHSLAKYVKVDEWFKLTRQGFAFYQKYFGQQYPFEKFDQLIVPEFNSGGMENAAAVTYSELFVNRAVETRNQRESRASVILHEMAHMWFGDLVTMDWWNGLWLNESFASYMAAHALASATEFNSAWLTFYAGRKQGAYQEDELVTTHPIDVPVEDTVRAFANFDGITYGKGASVLKQLVFYVGPDRFRAGVRAYLASHRFANATLEDFLSALEKESGRDLKRWAESWLRTSGHNSVKAGYECMGGKISSFRLESASPPAHSHVRPHRALVGLYDARLRRYASTEVDYESAADVPQLKGKACPALVFANAGDQDFAKLELDAASLMAAQAGVEKARDPLLRAMLFGTLWQMVRDAKFRVTDFADVAMRALPRENELRVATTIAGALSRTLHYLPLHGEPGEEVGNRYAQRIEEAFLGLLRKAAPGSDFQKLWFDSYAQVVRSPEGLRRLATLLERTLYRGLVVDPDRRWNLITRLNMFGVDGAEALIARELKRDKSDKAEKASVSAEAARPDAAVKRKWFSALLEDPAKFSAAKLKQALSLFPRNQQRYRAEYAPEYFRALHEVAVKKDGHFQRDFTHGLAPALCTKESAEALRQYIELNGELPAGIVKALKTVQDEDDRCVRVRGMVLGTQITQH